MNALSKGDLLVKAPHAAIFRLITLIYYYNILLLYILFVFTLTYRLRAVVRTQARLRVNQKLNFQLSHLR